MEIAEADHDLRRAIRLRKQINKIQDLESEISVQIPSHNLRNDLKEL
jgi:hypothetical protein